MIRISTLAASVKPSATLAAGAKARQLKTQGIKVLDFSLGEPDFNTPKHICDAAEKAALGGQTHYTPTSGTAEVKTAICAWYKRFHGLRLRSRKRDRLEMGRNTRFTPRSPPRWGRVTRSLSRRHTG